MASFSPGLLGGRGHKGHPPRGKMISRGAERRNRDVSGRQEVREVEEARESP